METERATQLPHRFTCDIATSSANWKDMHFVSMLDAKLLEKQSLSSTQVSLLHL